MEQSPPPTCAVASCDRRVEHSTMDGLYCTPHAIEWLIGGVQRLENASAMPAHPVGPHRDDVVSPPP